LNKKINILLSFHIIHVFIFIFVNCNFELLVLYYAFGVFLGPEPKVCNKETRV